MFEYPVELKKEKNGTVTVGFPDVPEAHSFGDNLAEALNHAVEALETALSFYIDDWRPLPTASAKRKHASVRPSLKGTMKLAIYQAMRGDKIRKIDLARRMKVAPMQVDRLLDLTHSSRIEQLESAFAALGQHVHLEMEPAE